MQAPSSSIAWNKLFLLSLFKTSLFWLAALQRFVQQVGGGILCSQKETGVWGDHSRNIPSLWQYKEPRAEKKKQTKHCLRFCHTGITFHCTVLYNLTCTSCWLFQSFAMFNRSSHQCRSAYMTEKKGNKSPLILLNSIKISLSIHQHCLSENTPPSSSFTIAFATS